MGLSWNSKVRHLPARELFLAGRGFGCSAGRRGVRRGVAAGPQPVLSMPSAGRSCWRRTSDSVAWTSPGARPSGVLRLRRLLFRRSVHRSGQSEGEFISLGHFEQLDLQAETAGVAGTCLGAGLSVSQCPGLDSAPPKSRGPAAGPLGKAQFFLPPAPASSLNISFSSQVHGRRDGDPPRRGGFRHQRAGAGLTLQCRSCKKWTKTPADPNKKSKVRQPAHGGPGAGPKPLDFLWTPNLLEKKTPPLLLVGRSFLQARLASPTSWCFSATVHPGARSTRGAALSL